MEKGSYKYYRVKLDDNARYQFTIVLSVLKGKSALFHSFTTENPKSKDDLVDETTDPDPERPWIEEDEERMAVSNKVVAMDAIDEIDEETGEQIIKQQIYYQIYRPLVQPNSVLYFSVKGLEDTDNDFEVYVHDKTVLDPNSSRALKANQFVYLGFLALLAHIALFKLYF